MNDKGTNDALENGISDCLRCLQRSSPGILLTGHQLKQVERDVKYVPSVSDAIASVVCRSKERSVYDNAMSIASGWNDEVKRIGRSHPGTAQRRGRVRRTTAERRKNVGPQVDEERMRIDALRPMLENRLRFVISDEFKEEKRSELKELQRLEREELAAAKKKAKMNEAAESDGMNSDCFESDGDGSRERSSLAESARDTTTIESHCITGGLVGHIKRRTRRGSSVTSSDQPSVASLQRDQSQGEPRQEDVYSDDSSPVIHTRR